MPEPPPMPDAPDTSRPNPFTACLERCLFGRRVLVLAVFALITLVMGWYAAQLRVDAGFFKLVPLKHEYMQTFLKHRLAFGDADRVVIAPSPRARATCSRPGSSRFCARSPTPCSSCPASTGPRSTPS